MKVNNVVRAIYTDREPLYVRLAADVKDRLKSVVEDRRWFFISRIKTLESFAMKVETGRVPNPAALDDFFACTIVVPTIADVAVAEALVYGDFTPVARRPKVAGTTHKRPWSFEFDDLRLFVKRSPQMSGASQDLDNLVFEIQIKTVLQYAWSVATHDLIYKTDSISWTKERIAFQVKAMLEHAEIAISEANSLASAEGFQRQDAYTDDILATLRVIAEVWDKDVLPSDMKRLAENIRAILQAAKVRATDLKAYLEAEIVRYGILPSDLSPYAFIVQALANDAALDLANKLRNDKRLRLFIHPGMDLPEWCRNHPQIISAG